MKKHILFPLILILILTSCGKPLYVSQILEQSSTKVISFEKYTEEGFLFTYSPTFYGDYDSKGMISCELFPQYNFEKNENRFIKSDVTTTSDYTVDLYVALDSMYQRAIKMDADAIIQLKVEQTIKTYKTPLDLDDDIVIREYLYPDEIVPYDLIRKHPEDYMLFDDIVILGVKVSGFAIKRLQ